MAEWVRALAWAGDRTVSRPGSNPATVTSLRNFGNSVYRALPVSFGGDTKSRRSLLSGVYARGSALVSEEEEEEISWLAQGFAGWKCFIDALYANGRE